MTLRNNTMGQIKSLTPILTIIYIILFSVLFSVYLISEHYRIPLAYLTRDTTAVLHGYPFAGIVSNIGILFWSFTVAICFFTSAILSKKNNVKVSTFLFFSGLLTSVLLLDDLFMLHEDIFPKYLNISQNLVYMGYFSLIPIYLLVFRRIILQTEYVILFFALSFFSLSVICDLVLPWTNIEYLIEDGFKLFGIITWLVYFTRTSFIRIQKIMITKE